MFHVDTWKVIATPLRNDYWLWTKGPDTAVISQHFFPFPIQWTDDGFKRKEKSFKMLLATIVCIHYIFGWLFWERKSKEYIYIQVGFFKKPRLGYPTSHEEDQKKKRNCCVRPGVSCPVPVFNRHDRRANSTLSALKLEVRKIPFP